MDTRSIHWKGCQRTLAEGQWWHFCGETDMGQTLPVFCEECEEKGLKLHPKYKKNAPTSG